MSNCKYRPNCPEFEHEDLVCCFMPPLCRRYREHERATERIKLAYENLRKEDENGNTNRVS